MESIVDLKLLKTFVAVTTHGSFALAAKQQHVVPSVVAKRIALLESNLGVRLFERTTRKVQLTVAGERLKSKALPLLLNAQELMADVALAGHTSAHGHLRIMAPTTLTTLYLGDLLTQFMQDNTHLSMEVVLGDRSINPIEDAFDMVISGRLASFEGVVQFPLAPIGYVLCASPSYGAKAPPLNHPTDLTQHACLVFEPFGRAWVFESSRGVIHVDVSPRLVADDNQTVLSACRKGLGVAVLPRYIAQADLDKGRLQRLLPQFALQEAWFKAYVPKRKSHLSHVVALKEYLTRALPKLNAAT